ncbi:MAG: WhiB family transcriptional regulator [Acidimicrobiia bacterium]|nr:WhiB family transcriptional regulator [Acidimicrobiia bacterium]
MAFVPTTASSWRKGGACRGDAAADFFPPMAPERKHVRLARERRAKSVCAACTVRAECLAYAIAADERYGVWGGLTQDERRLLADSA